MCLAVLTVLATFDKTLLIPIVILAGIGFCFGVSYFLRQRRGALIEALAGRRGFLFRSEGTDDDKQAIANSCFGTSRYSKITNVIEPVTSDDYKTTALDYSYSFKVGNNLDTAIQTVVRIQSPRLCLPAFLLRPASRLAKLGNFLGFTDIRLANAPKFNSIYLLRGGSESAIQSVFTPAVIQRCEQLRGFSIGGAGESLVIYRDRELAKPRDLEALMAEAKAIALLFAEAVSAGSATSGAEPAG